MIAKNRIAILCVSFVLCVAATGCGVGSPGAATPIAGTSFRGKVVGGQQPVTGSHVYLFAMGSTGYGSASTSITTLGASGVTTDSSNNGYVTTDSGGNFTLNSYTCPSSTSQVYFLAVGGNPGLSGTGVSNSAIKMISAVGQCSLQTPSTFVDINEVTTAASIVALQQFMVDTTHIGTSSTNAQGLTIAGNLVTADLVDPALGTPRSTTLSGTGTVPQAELYSLANMLAGCVNTSDPSQSGCTSLFSAAAPSGTSLPTDVAGAMLLIAKYPTANVNARYLLTTAQSPFPAGLTSQPNDWSVSVVFRGGGLLVPGAIAIDAAGDAWTANCPTCYNVTATDSIVGFGPYGAVLSGATGYTAGIHKPGAIAFDGLGNLWSVNAAGTSTVDQIVKQTYGTLDFAFNDSTISGPTGIACVGSTAWVANQNLSNVVQILSGGTRTLAPVTSTNFTAPAGVAWGGGATMFATGSGSNSILKFANNTGTVTSPAGGYTGSGMNQPINATVDAAGRVYTINNTGSLVSVLNGSDGSSVSGGGFAVGISNANDLVVDGYNQVWFANCSSSCGTGGADNVRHFSVSGTTVTNYDPVQPTGLSHPSDAAIDGSGNVWISNTGGQSLTELIGLAGPITTPLAVAAANTKIGQLP